MSEIISDELIHMIDKTLVPVRNNNGILIGHQKRYKDGGVIFPKGKSSIECFPFISRLNPTSRTVLVCEGPTDAYAAKSIVAEHTILGCWSSTTIPHEYIWQNILGESFRETHTFIVAGDGDKPGRAFNQRIANLVGSAYVVSIPGGSDLRDIINNNHHRARLLIARSTVKQPLTRTDHQKASRTYDSPHSDSIVPLVEQAGGQLSYKLGDGQLKFLCPLHDDRKDPSLTVDPSTGSWKCWAGCGQGGPIQFIMKWKGKSYEDSVNLLRKYV